MIDIHVHFGKFRDIQLNIPDIIENLTKQGINQIGLMPLLNETGSNLNNAHSTLKKYYSIYETQIIPILWIYPKISIQKIERLISEIPYKIIKIHGYLHHWDYENITRIINFTEQKKLPIMFHTGGCENSDAGFYMQICKNFPKQKIILAHGRPIEQTIEILQLCKNVWVDTAFMPTENIKLLIDKDFANKILFGTDYPIMKHFDNSINLDKWYKQNTKEIIETIGNKYFEQLSSNNIAEFLNN